MQALRKTRAAPGVELVDVAPPVLSPQTAHGDVLVRVRAAGICGSDHHVDDWTPSYAFVAPHLPVTLGHEFVGTALGGALAGRRVVVRPSVTCGVCDACRAQRFDACEQRRGLGMTRDGAFAALVRVPERNCVPVPDDVPDELACRASIKMRTARQSG
jgi:threonine dehydrogenase-like Zn-dependent dehydrogenase